MAQNYESSNVGDLNQGRRLSVGAKLVRMGSGTVVGPMGVAAVAVSSASVGDLSGNETAERFTATAEDAHWRNCYTREWYYEPGRTYDDYGPAYEFGFTRWSIGAGAFDTVEPELENEWIRHRRTSRLDWITARHATRAAWGRVGNTYGFDPDTGIVDCDGAADKREIVNVLNELVETSHDGECGFRTSADEVQSPTLKQAFSARAQECGRAAHQLGKLIRRFGGTPVAGGTVGGALQRGWVRVKGVLGAISDKSILDECERGEDVAAARYRAALEVALPEDVRRVVS